MLVIIVVVAMTALIVTGHDTLARLFSVALAVVFVVLYARAKLHQRKES